MIIPKVAIDGWKEQYRQDSELFLKYNLSHNDQEHFLDLVSRDEDLVRKYAFSFVGGPPKDRNPIYLATAGAPLAGKSTELDHAVMDRQGLYHHAVRIDPDVMIRMCGE